MGLRGQFGRCRTKCQLERKFPNKPIDVMFYAKLRRQVKEHHAAATQDE